MSDLIRREDVIKLVNQFVFGVRKEQVHESKKAFIKYIEKMPTAYSVDKVVDELKERADFLKDCTKYGNKNAKQQAESYNTMMMYEVADLVDDLIEIVQQGGVSDDLCEWESVDGEFIQNPHTKRLYSNEPSMKNVYCNTCGKKIKVVE